MAEESSAVVDKSAEGLDARQYHIGIAPGEVSSVALLPGDPFRVPLIAEFLAMSPRWPTTASTAP